MAIGLILLSILLFIVGILTPLNDLYTIPISIILVIVGIKRLVKKR